MFGFRRRAAKPIVQTRADAYRALLRGTMRPELDAANMPLRMKKLPIDDRGYPVPWFVAWQDGKPEFRAMDAQKWNAAVRHRLCWVCGEPLGRYMTFVIGPMCAINLTTSEPPSHSDCATWSAKNCPFLTRPHMTRREDDEINAEAFQQPNQPGTAILRNPGVALLWTTRTYSIFRDVKHQPLIQIGEPESIAWFCEGRPATRAEVAQSVDTGLPLLRAAAKNEPDTKRRTQALAEIDRRACVVVSMYPAA